MRDGTEGAREVLYREMMCSPGGVMLLVRLRAGLGAYPVEALRGLAGLEGEGTDGPRASDGPDAPGLAPTLDWLGRKFGRANARRALAEAARELIRIHEGADLRWRTGTGQGGQNLRRSRARGGRGAPGGWSRGWPPVPPASPPPRTAP